MIIEINRGKPYLSLRFVLFLIIIDSIQIHRHNGIRLVHFLEFRLPIFLRWPFGVERGGEGGDERRGVPLSSVSQHSL
jgi:hypothetical protein